MLIIQLPKEELKIPPEVTVGNRNRFSTVTAVSFITETLLLVATFNSKRIRLIEILEDNSYNILDEVKTRHCPDLMDYKNGVVLTSDYPHGEPNGHASIYDIINNKIIFRKEIVLKNTKAHGGRILDDKTIIITSNSDHNRGCLFIDVGSGEILKNFNNFQYYPKNVYIGDNKLFIVSSESLPQIGKITIIKKSILNVFDINTFEKIDEITFDGQTDSIVMKDEKGFITVQGDDTVVCYTFIDNRLEYIGRITGFNFPHGIDAIENKIAITNYGDNTVKILNFAELNIII